jgi:hypothetical protein
MNLSDCRSSPGSFLHYYRDKCPDIKNEKCNKCSKLEEGKHQGAIITVNLATRFSRNLKASHKIIVGFLALCCNKKSCVKYYKILIKNRLFSIKDSFFYSCTRIYLFPVKRIKYLSRRKLLSQD